MIIILISILKNLVSFLFQTAQHHTAQAFLQLINLNLSRWNLQNSACQPPLRLHKIRNLGQCFPAIFIMRVMSFFWQPFIF